MEKNVSISSSELDTAYSNRPEGMGFIQMVLCRIKNGQHTTGRMELVEHPSMVN